MFRLVPSMRPIGEIACGLWPTPTASADKSSRTPDGAMAEVLRGKSPDLSAHVMALWPTLVARDANTPHSAEYVKAKRAEGHGMANLNDTVAALWSTPTAPDHKSILASTETHERNSRPLSETVGAALGLVRNGSLEPTEKPGALNPQFVSWLMGFPPEWASCAPTAMPSSRKSQRK